MGSKDNLIALAGDQVWNEIALPDLTAADWRTAAAAMATDLYAMLTRHPWLVQAFGSLVLYGPGKARHDDHSLAIYEAAGFTGAQADQAAAAVFTFVLGNALGAAAAASLTRKLGRDGGNAAGAAPRPHGRSRTRSRRSSRGCAPASDTAAARYGAAPDNSFEFGLHAILDGLQAKLASRLRD